MQFNCKVHWKDFKIIKTGWRIKLFRNSLIVGYKTSVTTAGTLCELDIVV